MLQRTEKIKNVIGKGIKMTGVMIATTVAGELIAIGSERVVDKAIETITSINDYINPIEYRKEKWYSLKKSAYNVRTGKKIK